MQTEIEAKFLGVDHDLIRAKLKKLGAVCEQPMRLMRRKNLDYPDGRLDKLYDGWIRVRDEGDKVTLSYKQLNERTLHGMKEVSLVVEDFDLAAEFLLSVGLAQKSYQETKRESWSLDDVQIELDEWPWIRPFIEVEGPNEVAVRSAVERLGLAWENALFGSVEIAYQAEYNATGSEIDHWEEIIFKPVPAWLGAKRKKATA